MVFLEVILIPAAILAALGGAGQVTLGIVAVFAWRILMGLGRLTLVGFIPATSILTFAFLSARTGAGATMGIAELGSPLVAYILPGSIVSALGGLFFMWSSFRDRPLVLKLAQDFVTLSDEAKTRLLPLFKGITFTIGLLHFFFALAGAVVVFTTPPEQASVLHGLLCVATPIVIGAACFGLAIGVLRRMGVRISFKEPLAAVPA